jgi:hypothetical protein
MKHFLPCTVILFLAGTALADTVILRDGSIRHGTVESRNAQHLRLRIDRDGISSVVVIPASQIARVIVSPATSEAAPASAPATASAPAASLPSAPPETSPSNTTSAPTLPAASEAELDAYQSRGFLWELAASALGKGPDNPERLPAATRELWNQTLAADSDGKQAETLEAMRNLESAMRDLPAGLSRLDAIARRQRNESFGTWMARIRWDLTKARFSTGQFDLHDVRDIERPALVTLLRQATTSALEPLKTHFPPVDDKTGLQKPFQVSQLQGITATNALEVKDQSLFAAAVLLAQLKLEPDMPPADRRMLSTELQNVNRVLARARDLEPAAKAAKIRAEQERKAAEEKAKRDAAAATPKTTPG